MYYGMLMNIQYNLWDISYIFKYIYISVIIDNWTDMVTPLTDTLELIWQSDNAMQWIDSIFKFLANYLLL